jgi:hypothetical protein
MILLDTPVRGDTAIRGVLNGSGFRAFREE